MPLSASYLSELVDVQAAVAEFFDELVGEVDDQVDSLRSFDVSLSKTGEAVAEEATDLAVDILDSFDIPVA